MTEYETKEEILCQVRDFLRNEDVGAKVTGPWSRKNRHQPHIILNDMHPDDVHNALWIEVDLKLMEISLIERNLGKTSYLDLSLYEEDCFERLANAARNAAMGVL